MIKKPVFKFTVITLLLGLLHTACNNDLTMVGSSILPPGDIITVYSDTFNMKISTVKIDSVFAKTTDFMLGEMYDPEYGNIKADFMCQFYCEEGFEFRREAYQGIIDSTVLFIMYSPSAWYGDSLVPMRASVYPVKAPLKRNFYTNEDPEPYCDMNNPLGEKTYTSYDKSVSDSIRALTNQDDNYYFPNIRIKLTPSLGQQIYDEAINNPSTFANQNAFNAFFPGLYVTTTFGSGNLIKSVGEYVSIRLYYKYMGKGSQQQDSVMRTSQDFCIAKEVIQINRFKNSNIDKLLQDGNAYIKSPAGVFARLTVPTSDISKKLNVNDRFINDFSLKIRFYQPNEWNYAYYPPLNLLVVPEDSVKSFFENEKIEDDLTSFISYDASGGSSASKYTTQYGYTSSNYTYTFGNISSLLKNHIEKAPDRDLNLLVIPVTRTTSTQQNYDGSSTYYTSGISNSFYLSGVKIRNDEESMKIVVMSSKFENN
ncbi:MAG: DUF4270 domain-containing protein [Tannerella sp.]|jgi:hypothetical protein|nr:DUF4270 domain-containing protein [Tannerella sp.]